MAGATGQRSSQLNGTIPFPPKEDFAIASYLVPDSVSRVFHPQRVGHALIANLIMYTIASRQAISMGMQPPPRELKNIGSSCPMAPSPACSGSSSHTWFSRDAAISAVSSFCQNYANLAGTAGTITSATFNPNIFDYLSISIAWHEDLSLGENQFNNWFDIIVDGCDTSTITSKHGGSIGFATNVTLSIDSLVMQRLWDGGKVSIPHCNGIDNNHYITQSAFAGLRYQIIPMAYKGGDLVSAHFVTQELTLEAVKLWINTYRDVRRPLLTDESALKGLYRLVEAAVKFSNPGDHISLCPTDILSITTQE